MNYGPYRVLTDNAFIHMTECHSNILLRNMLYLGHASYLELDEEALHGAEAACSLR